jgi:hypothetical protein
MFALHHPRGVLCAQTSNKVKFEEYPPPAELGSWNLSTLCHALQRNRMQLQEFSSIFEVKRLHAKGNQEKGCNMS